MEELSPGIPFSPAVSPGLGLFDRNELIWFYYLLRPEFNVYYSFMDTALVDVIYRKLCVHPTEYSLQEDSIQRVCEAILVRTHS